MERMQMMLWHPYRCSKTMEHRLVYQTNPMGVQLFSYVNTFFWFIELFDVSFN